MLGHGRVLAYKVTLGSLHPGKGGNTRDVEIGWRQEFGKWGVQRDTVLTVFAMLVDWGHLGERGP